MLCYRLSMSKYLLGQEHLTDREIDELYQLADNLKLRLDRFREYDKKYRELEGKGTNESEAERADILNACASILDEVITNLQKMEESGSDIKELFLKAKGALEAELEHGK